MAGRTRLQGDSLVAHPTVWLERLPGGLEGQVDGWSEGEGAKQGAVA